MLLEEVKSVEFRLNFHHAPNGDVDFGSYQSSDYLLNQSVTVGFWLTNKPIQNKPIFSLPMSDNNDNQITETPEDANKVLFPYLSTLFWYLREGVIFVDREYNVGAWSQAVEKITGRSSAETTGQTIRPALMLSLIHI